MRQKISETSNILYDKILAALPVGIIISDTHGNNIHVNDELVKISGYSSKELLDGVWMIDPNDLNARGLYYNALSGTEGVNYETKLIRKDGSVVWVSISWKPTLEEDGAIAGSCTTFLDVTQRKLTEDSLLQVGQRLKQITERASDILWEMTPDGVFTYASDATRVFGYSPDEWVGHSLLEFLPSKEQIEFMRLLSDKNRTAGPRRYEMAFLRKDGSVAWLEILSDAIYSNDRVISYHGVSRDISARKQAELALQRSEEKYKSIVENSSDMILLTTSEGQLTYVSPACSEITGYSPEEIIESQVWIIHPADTERMRKQFQRARDGFSEVAVEYRILAKSGETRWVSQSWSPAGDGGDVGLIVSVIRDITERVKSQAALRESEERYKGIVEHSNDLIMLCRPDGVWTYASPACRDILGYEPEEVVGTMPALSLPEDDVWLKPFFIEAMRGKGGSNLQYRMVTKSGEIKWISHSWSPVYSGKRLQSLINIIRDINEVKQSEQALRAAHTELKHAYRLQQEFLNNVTHEVRTPLTAVKGYAEMLLEGVAGPISQEQSALLTKVLTGSDHLLEIVNAILEIARLKSGKVALKRKVCDPRKTADKAASIVRPQAEKKGLVINVKTPSIGCPATYDEDKLLIIITNLLTNAVKFTEQGSIDIEVECRSTGADFVVVDTGIGIPSNSLTDIYDEFSQLDYPRKHKPAGFGIGLAIVATMIEAIGATLTVSSIKGKGTAFTLSAPAIEEA